ncbi:hypothetical protein EYR38_010494 [Pleurotus pulmonarius]|nr:hypothetical protein EYR38_010494 [Pleurotus pulmonarius]
MLAVGLSWRQALPAIALGHIIISVVMVLNGTIGARLHVAFPVLNRSSFGFWFSYFSIISRIVLAMFWFGIQTYTGSECLYQMLKAIWPSVARVPNQLSPDANITTVGVMCYFLYWLLQFPFMLISPQRIRYFFMVKSVVVPISWIAILAWSVHKVPVSVSLESKHTSLQGSDLSWAWLSALNSALGIYSTLAVNIPDFTRYAKTERSQYIQIAIIPTVFTFCGFIGIAVTSAGEVLYGETLWDPTHIIDRWDNRAAAFFAAFSFCLTTIGTNISANSLSAANDMTVLFPQFINIRRGQVLCALLGGWALCPWEILASASGFLNFMNGYTVFLGPFAGIMVADYWIVHRCKVDVPAMYDPHGRYAYWHGTNWRAVLALLLSVPPSFPGLISSINPDIQVGAVKHVFDIAWLYGFFTSLIVYSLTSTIWPARETFVEKSIYGYEDDDDFSVAEGSLPEKTDVKDIQGSWKKLGSGSFGNVYKGSYLGIEVAIKEVLPSTEYDVAKYFEREWRLMKEARHPNVVLYLGLSRAPDPDGRIFIISEFIENGNLRSYIFDKTKPFPWRLRISFATDIARALAYLHARKCIHRDLKGENLLVTSNGRLKITDFGFARIAARNEDELKRLTFCGTDSYMSPEILLGDEFDLPTDIFSLGIIFCEIAARKLADDSHFKRTPPSFGIDEAEVRERASSGCPEGFISLCLDCSATDPSKRPTTRNILERLRVIEAEVLARPDEADNMHLGSVKFMTGGKRTGTAPRIPSFGVGVGKDIRGSGKDDESDESEDELMEAVIGLSKVDLNNSTWSGSSMANEPLLNRPSSSEYSTTVVKSHPNEGTNTHPPSLSSILTIRPSPDPNETPAPVLPATPLSESVSSLKDGADAHPKDTTDILGTSSIMSIATMDSYRTAPSYYSQQSAISTALATEGGSTIRSLYPASLGAANGQHNAPLVHRFTLLKPGAKPKRASGSFSPNGNTTSPNGGTSEGPSTANEAAVGWNPLELFFGSGLLVSKCDLCTKRLGWKPVLECDDCGLRTHVKCGELAPRDCGLRPIRPGFGMSPSMNAIVSSAGKGKQAATPAVAVKSANKSPPR